MILFILSVVLFPLLTAHFIFWGTPEDTHSLQLWVCKRIGLIDFKLNRQILNSLVRFFGLKISARLKSLVYSIFVL
jgi:hypothetical protein